MTDMVNKLYRKLISNLGAVQGTFATYFFN